MQVEDGRLYLLRGGHLVRYLGPHSGWGPRQVLRALSKDDARGLRRRQVQLLHRRMFAEADWTGEVMAELEIQPSKCVKDGRLHEPWKTSSRT